MIERRHDATDKDVLWYLQLILVSALILYFGRTLFVPLSFGLLISFVLYPVCRWMERRGVGRALSIVLALLILMLIGGALIWLLVSQFVSFTKVWPTVQAKFLKTVTDLSHVFSDVFGITADKQKSLLNSISSQSGGSILSFLKTTLMSSLSSLVLFVLIPVYSVIILYYREYWMKVLGRIFAGEREEDLRRILLLSVETYFSFIRGMVVVYLMVGALNTAGLMALGIPNAILFGFVASILTIVPYVGIVIGASLPVAMAWITYDSIWYPIGIVGLFTFVQYLEANVIFPFAVSHRLNVNTLVMLLVIFAGGILWGLSGMILFVPFVGIAKLIADQNPKWKTISMILGVEKPK
jgi:predicted PurR-regulated permease PerM